MLFLITNLRRTVRSMSSWQPRKNRRWLLIPVAYLLILTTSFSQVVISEVHSNGTFELQNNGNTSVDLSNYWICNFPSYERLTSLSIECGSLNLAAGEEVTLSGFSYSGDNGELGLYAMNSFGSADAIRSYVDWGSATGGRANVAVSAGIWTQGERANSFSNSESLQLEGTGNSANDWSVNASPIICEDVPTSSTNTARYRVTFDAFWSSETHPTDFPGSNAHFSGLIGLSHSENVSLFELGNIASPGIVNMAETGGKSPLTSEIDAIIASGEGFAQINGGGIGVSPNSVSVEFDLDEAHPLASITSMIAPSPDWFVGARGVNLFENGDWLNKTVTVAVYDAGSDDGATFTSPNQATNPRAEISRITDGPLAVNGVVASMGTLTFERIDGPATTSCDLVGGTLSGGPFSFTVGDGVADNIAAGSITLANNSGTNSQWVVTDDQGNILGLPPMPSAVNFDGAGAGTCLIWHLSFEDGLQGAEVGMNASDLQGCYSLSNSIEVVRTNADGCNANGGTLLGGPFTFCVDGVVDNIPTDGLNLIENSGTNNQWVVTDLNGNILGLPPTFSAPDFDSAGGGVCLVWNLAYENGLTGLAMGNNVNQLEGCYSLSNSVSVTRNEPAGGTISGGPFSFCVGDGVPDNIAAGSIGLLGNTGSKTQWIVTDDQGNILGLPPMPSAVDFDGAGAGTCLIWHLSYEGEIQGLEAGQNASDLQGCFSLSNSVTVNRNTGTDCNLDCSAQGGTLTGGPFNFCVGDGVSDNITAGSIQLKKNQGANSQWVVTDDQGNILGLPPMPSAVDFDGAGEGTCLIWHLSYEGEIQGAEVGMNANNIKGCFSLSNPVTVNRSSMGGVCDALSCEVPEEGTATFKSPTRLRLNWEAISDAKGYVIQIRLKGRSAWAITAPLRYNFVRIWAIPNRDFEYRIKTICSNGESEYSSVFEFSTKAGNFISNTATSRSTDTFEVDVDLRNQLEVSVTLQVAPNPFYDKLNVGYEVQGEEAILSIYHISGQKVFERVLTKDGNNQTLSLGDLNAGIFLMTIQEEGFPILNRRIVKQDR